MKNLPIPENAISPADKFMEIISLLSVGFSIIYVIINYNSLPETIPVHFNFEGKPDGYGSKLTLLLIPVINIILTIGMLLLVKYPHKFNYLVKITSENAQVQYRIAQRMLRSLTLADSLLFSYISYMMVNSAFGKYYDFEFYSIFVFLFLIFGILIFYFVKSSKYK